MRYIKVNSTSFKLASNENVSASRLQATILKEANTVEAIAAAFDGSSKIDILEDSEVVATYNGYSSVLGVVLRKDQTVDHSGTVADTVSVELLNVDLQAQLDALDAKVKRVESTQASQAATISTIDSAVTDLGESQTDQDLAIEDLAEVVSGIVEPTE